MNAQEALVKTYEDGYTGVRTAAMPESPGTPTECPVEECQNCGADAAEYVYWNWTGGWSCRKCGESDYPEAAE